MTTVGSSRRRHRERGLPKLRVLVVDDSILFRRVMMEVLGSLPEVEVVGSASNGSLAVQKVRELHPDLLTLDLEMPGMDGLEVLDTLRGDPAAPAVIVVSARTRESGRLTVRALQKGAFDFIAKPETASPELSRQELRNHLAPRVKALSLRLAISGILRGEKHAPVARFHNPPADSAQDLGKRMARVAGTNRPELVLIGVSTGGPNALGVLLAALPADFPVPILIVQHMPPIFTQSLAETLDEHCALRVVEAADGMVPAAGFVYIAPGGRQMRLVPGGEGCSRLETTDDPPENACRPSVDYLFRSVANNFPGRAMAVIMTGMGADGVVGLRLLKRHGCHVIAQDEASCVVYGMPGAAVAAGVVDRVLPLEEIAGRIVSLVQRPPAGP